MLFVNRLSMSWKILIPVIVLVSVLCVMTAFSLNGLYNAMLNERILASQHISQNVASIVNSYIAKEKAGEMTRAEAEAAAVETLSMMRFDNGNYVYAFGYDGVAKSHVKKSLIGKSLIGLKDKTGIPIIEGLIAAAKKGGGVLRFYWEKPGVPKVNGKAPLLDKYGWGEPVEGWSWMVGTGVYVDDIKAEFWSQARVQVIIGSMGALVALIVAFAMFRSIAPPIKRLTNNMQALANGSSNVVVEDADRVDEVGQMANAISIFIEKEDERQGLIRSRVAEQEEALVRSEDLRVECTAFDSEILAIMDTVKDGVSSLASSTVGLNEMADSTLNESNSVMNEANTASLNVETVASATEELSASVSEIGHQVQMSTKIASKAASEGGETSKKVQQLANAASKIGEVVSLINDIAEQTNLLALNATIEAARAGEAGRGFSVVASEVKQLSTQTTKATEEISGQISAIQAETLEASNAINSVTKTVVEMNEITSSIATAVEQQRHVVQEIAQNAVSASEGTVNVTESMGTVSSSAKGTRENAEQVRQIASQIEEATQTSVGKINNFLDKVKQYG